MELKKSSSLNTSRVDDIYEDWNKKDKKFILHYGDITEFFVCSKFSKQNSSRRNLQSSCTISCGCII